MNANVRPFRIHVPQSMLDDLSERLAKVRWPDEIAGAGWDYGVNRQFLKNLADYWQSTFDWRAHETSLNRFSHFKASVDSQDIHFVHERGIGTAPFPLVITHGWPSSFAEMLKIVPLLTDPVSHGGKAEDAFDVIIPSLPGYGFSGRPTSRGCNVQRIAAMWNGLMTDILGYSRFGAHGSDWGASVTARLGYAHPASVAGIHVTTVSGGTPSAPFPGTPPLSEAEKARFESRARWYEAEGAYQHVQSTKPQTLTYALNDSPVGLLAELVEKFRTWSDCEGDVGRIASDDELLVNVMIYWVTETIGSSMRIYHEYCRAPWTLEPGERIDVPVGIASLPRDTNPPLREWAERFYNVTHWTDFSRGGHFPAIETPELLVNDLREFFRPLRAEYAGHAGKTADERSRV